MAAKKTDLDRWREALRSGGNATRLPKRQPVAMTVRTAKDVLRLSKLPTGGASELLKALRQIAIDETETPWSSAQAAKDLERDFSALKRAEGTLRALERTWGQGNNTDPGDFEILGRLTRRGARGREIVVDLLKHSTTPAERLATLVTDLHSERVAAEARLTQLAREIGKKPSKARRKDQRASVLIEFFDEHFTFGNPPTNRDKLPAFLRACWCHLGSPGPGEPPTLSEQNCQDVIKRLDRRSKIIKVIRAKT